jgi:hypothetical protein
MRLHSYINEFYLENIKSLISFLMAMTMNPLVNLQKVGFLGHSYRVEF